MNASRAKRGQPPLSAEEMSGAGTLPRGGSAGYGGRGGGAGMGGGHRITKYDGIMRAEPRSEPLDREREKWLVAPLFCSQFV